MPPHLLASPESLSRIPAPWVLLDCRPGAEAFASGHLPGALHADLDRTLSSASEPDFDPSKGGRHPLPQLSRWSKQLGEWGITPETPVIACDSASGGNGAARLWWMLQASGHVNVAVLDGGIQAALDAGYSLTDTLTTPNATSPYPVERWLMPQVNLSAADRLRTDRAWKLLDVRAAERWRGEVEPIDPVAGRIPGSLNFAWGGNLDQYGKFKAPEELRALYLSLLDRTPIDHLAIHCGSGVTACHTLLALEVAGLRGSSVYMGSYSEWCRNGKPIQKG